MADLRLSRVTVDAHPSERMRLMVAPLVLSLMALTLSLVVLGAYHVARASEATAT
jgi:hypothetical protein